MTSVFRLISRNFDPPATVENAGVRPAQDPVAVTDLPAVEADFDHLSKLSEDYAANEGAQSAR